MAGGRTSCGLAERVKWISSLVRLFDRRSRAVARLKPDYIDSSQLQFTKPGMPIDGSTLYSGPITLCVQADNAATCYDTFGLTPPVVSSAVRAKDSWP
jgi:hypothetical protein